MAERITIRRPDDWHLHVRDGAMLKASLPFSARTFGRGIIMPNLVPPVRTVADAEAYRARLLAALPEGSTFEPLMTCYMTDETSPDEVERGFRERVFTAVKIYPAHATTYSAAGVTDFRKIRPVLARMEKIGMPLLIHGEEADPAIDVFDREAVFIDRWLRHWLKDFPGLKMVLEHISTATAVDFVRDAAPQLGATITPYHLMLTRTDMLGFGIKPYFYCMPVLKRASDRLALRKAATSGDPCFFLGTDSAPHPVAKKLDPTGIPGLFNSPVAIESYAQVFEEEGALRHLEAFAALYGARHYGLPFNSDTITLEASPWTAPEEVLVEGPDGRALVHRGGEKIRWRVTSA